MRCLLSALVLGLPIAAQAAPTLYVCDVDTNRTTGVFQQQFVIAHDVAERVVSVNDALIQGVNGGPLLGRVATDNGTRIVFSWTVRNVPSTTGQVASLQYRATIMKADGALQMSMKPLNYDNSFSAAGTCKTQ